MTIEGRDAERINARNKAHLLKMLCVKSQVSYGRWKSDNLVIREETCRVKCQISKIPKGNVTIKGRDTKGTLCLSRSGLQNPPHASPN